MMTTSLAQRRRCLDDDAIRPTTAAGIDDNPATAEAPGSEREVETTWDSRRLLMSSKQYDSRAKSEIELSASSKFPAT